MTWYRVGLAALWALLATAAVAGAQVPLTREPLAPRYSPQVIESVSFAPTASSVILGGRGIDFRLYDVDLLQGAVRFRSGNLMFNWLVAGNYRVRIEFNNPSAAGEMFAFWFAGGIRNENVCAVRQGPGTCELFFPIGEGMSQGMIGIRGGEPVLAKITLDRLATP